MKPSSYGSFFETGVAETCTMILLGAAVASAGLALEAFDINFGRYGMADTAVWVLSVSALLLAVAVSYWSAFVSMAITRTLRPALVELPLSPPTPRRIKRLVSSPSHWQTRYQDLPTSWRSPWATTIRRLRVVAVLAGFFILQLLANYNGVAHDDFGVLAYVVDFVVLTILSLAVPILLVDIARRRVRGHESSVVVDRQWRAWVRQIVSLVLGLVLLIVTGVNLCNRVSSVIDHPIALAGRGSTTVALSASMQTIYAGCDDDLQCSPLPLDAIHVVGLANHRVLSVVPDQGIDHESFHEHPWLSVANFTVPSGGSYRITLDGEAEGQYALSLSQVQLLHVIAPLVLTAVYRVVGLGLAIAVVWDLSKFRRRRVRGSTVEPSTN